MENKGKLFVIESGTDGSGKATQSELLYNRLIDDGYNVKKVSYPDYESQSSALVKMYLNGDIAKKADDVDAYIASTFFAADRYISYKMNLEEYFNSGGIIIADRYTTSNMVHQASKMDSDEDKEKFLKWLYDFEYGLYGIPVPDEVFFLDVNVATSEQLIKNRLNKFTNDSKKDIHESDKEYLIKTYENSKYVAKKYDWNIIDCINEEGLRSIESIHEEIYKKVKECLDKDLIK